jgi:hypothetical protein
VVYLNRLEMSKFIQSLNEHEASRVLKGLLDENPDFLKKAYDCAMKVAADVDIDGICDSVFTCLSMLHIEELNGRTGMTQYGYVSPDDAARELIEDVLAPFVGDIVKNRERGLPAAAKACCIGIIKGIRMYDEDPDSDFGGWAEDLMGKFIETVVEEWKKGDPGSEDIDEVERVAEGELS